MIVISSCSTRAELIITPHRKVSRRPECQASIRVTGIRGHHEEPVSVVTKYIALGKNVSFPVPNTQPFICASGFLNLQNGINTPIFMEFLELIKEIKRICKMLKGVSDL